MKKLTLLALSLLALSFTSCSSGDDGQPTAEVVATTTYSISGTITGATSATVTLYKGTATVKSVTSSGSFSFTGLEKADYTVKITSTGCVDQSVDVSLTDKNADAVVSAAMVKASTETKAVAEVVGQTTAVTVTNDASSQQTAAATVAIQVPASTTITNASSIPATATFSVTPYVPASTTTELTTTASTTVEAPVMALVCEPTGATFSKPVTLAVDLGESAIEASYLKLVNGNESKTVSLSGTTYSGEVSHFSTWTFELNPTVTTSDEQSTTTAKTISLNAGSHDVAYSSMTGYEIVSTTITSKILKSFIQSHFGAAAQTISKNATANVTGNGVLAYNVVQKYRTATIKLGSKTVATIKIYSGATFANSNFTPSAHSGGNGQ